MLSVCTMATIRKKMGFFDLPAELRIRIYSLVLPSKDTIWPTDCVVNYGTKYSYPARILRTSKVFAQEAGALLYSTPKFSFITHHKALKFLIHIGDAHSNCIRKLSFGFGPRDCIDQDSVSSFIVSSKSKLLHRLVHDQY